MGIVKQSLSQYKYNNTLARTLEQEINCYLIMTPGYENNNVAENINK